MKKLKILLSDLENNIHYLFLVVAAPALVAFILYVPAGYGPDEQVHIARAYHISIGELYPKPLGEVGRYGGNLPKALVDNIEYGHDESTQVHFELPFYDKNRKDITDIERTRSIDTKPINDSGHTIYDFGPTGPYSPANYGPAAAGFFISRLANLSADSSVELARAFQALVYLAVIFSALYVLAKKKVKWLVFMVALLPTSIFQSATVSADALTTAAALLFFSLIYLFLNKSYKFNKHYTYLLTLSSFMMAVTKPSNAIMLAALLLIPSKRIWGNKKAKYVKYGIILASFGIVAATSLAGAGFSDSMIVYKSEDAFSKISLEGQARWSARHPVAFLKTLGSSILDFSEQWYFMAIGVLGYNRIATPFLLIMTTTVGLAMASLYSATKNLKIGIIMLITGASSYLAAILLLYASFNTVGAPMVSGVQGRYFVPVFPFFFSGLAQFVPIDFRTSDRVALVTFGSISLVTLYVTLWAYLLAIY